MKKSFFNSVLVSISLVLASFLMYQTINVNTLHAYTTEPDLDTLIDLSLDSEGKFNKNEVNKFMVALLGDEGATYKKFYSAVEKKSYNSSDFSKINAGNINAVDVKINDHAYMAVYLTMDKDKAPVVTFYETFASDRVQFSNYGAYTTDLDADKYPSSLYGTSYIRNYLVGSPYSADGKTLFDATSAKKTQSPIYRNFIEKYDLYLDTPSEVGYQEDESQFNTSGKYNASYGTNPDYVNEKYKEIVNKQYYDAWKDDKIWIPSSSEIGMNSEYENRPGYNGIWGLTAPQRAGMSAIWLRSALYYHDDSLGDGTWYLPEDQFADGTNHAHPTTNIIGIRIAFHLNLEHVMENINSRTVIKRPEAKNDGDVASETTIDYPNQSNSIEFENFDFNALTYKVYYYSEESDIGQDEGLDVTDSSYFAFENGNKNLLFHTPHNAPIGTYILKAYPQAANMWKNTALHEEQEIARINVKKGKISKPTCETKSEEVTYPDAYGGADTSDDLKISNINLDTIDYRVVRDESEVAKELYVVGGKGDLLYFKTPENSTKGTYKLMVKPKENFVWSSDDGDNETANEIEVCSIKVIGAKIELNTNAITGYESRHDDFIHIIHYFDSDYQSGAGGAHPRTFEPSWFNVKGDFLASIQYCEDTDDNFETEESYVWSDSIEPVTDVGKHYYYLKVNCENHEERIFKVEYEVVNEIATITFNKTMSHAYDGTGVDDINEERLWNQIESVTDFHYEEKELDTAAAIVRLKQMIRLFLVDDKGSELKSQRKGKFTIKYEAKAGIGDLDSYYVFNLVNAENYEITPATDNTWITEFNRNKTTYGDNSDTSIIMPSAKYGTPSVSYYKDKECHEPLEFEGDPNEFFKTADAGTYYARVEVKTDSYNSYNGLSQVYSIIISKADDALVDGDFDVADFNYGHPFEETKPNVKSNSEVTIKYYRDEACENEISYAELKTAPKGTYYGKVIVEESTNYNAFEYKFSFEITYSSDNQLDNKDSINDFTSGSYTYAETLPEPSTVEKPTSSYGDVTVKYYTDANCQNEIENPEEYFKNADAGTYFVKVEVLETESYNGTSEIYQFTINKAENSLKDMESFEFAGFTFGEPVSPTIPEANFENATVTIKFYTDETRLSEISESDLRLANVGKYYGRVIIASTTNYLERIYDFEFNIDRSNNNAWLLPYSRDNFVYKTEPSIINQPISLFGEPKISYYYDENLERPIENQDNPDEFFKTAKAGTYYAKVEVEGTDNYNGLSDKYSFTIDKALNEWNVEFYCDDFIYGDAPETFSVEPSVKNEDDEAEITITYYTDRSCEERYKIENPAEYFDDAPVGMYYAKVDASETTNYQAMSSVYDFSILMATNDFDQELNIPSITYGEATPETFKNNATSLFGTTDVKYYRDETCLDEISVEELATADAGVYFAKVTVEGNGNYNGLSKVYPFVINQADNEFDKELEITDFEYGSQGAITTYPTTKHGGNIIFKLYRDESCLDEILPEELSYLPAGRYYAKVIVEATTNYKRLEKVYHFDILAATDNEWINEYKRSDFTFGSKPSVYVTPVSKYGTPVITYYKDSAYQQEITEESLKTAPAGTYYVKVVVNATSDYNGLETKYSFRILPTNNRFIQEYSRDDFVYGETPSVPTMPKVLDGTPIITYYKDASLTEVIDENEIATAPVGKYYVKVTVEATASCQSIEGIYSFSILKANNSWLEEYNRKDYTVGSTPSEETNPVSKFGEATIEYYKDITCTESEKINKEDIKDIGTYYVKVTVEGTDNYNGLEKVYKFSIVKKNIAFDMGILVGVVGLELLIMLVLAISLKRRRKENAKYN